MQNRIKKLFSITAVVAAMALFSPFAFGQSVPVKIYWDEDLDPCGYGVVRGLNPNRDGFLAVRTGPGTSYGLVDKIFEEQELYLCDYSDGWHGVLYTKKGTDCFENVPQGRVSDYNGRCWHGWAHENWILFLAG